MIERLSAKIIGIIVLAALVVFIIVWGPAQCRKVNTANKQAEIAKGQGGAALDAGAEAGNTLTNVTANQAATDAAVEQGQGEVRAAPEGKKGQAAVNAACRFKANRNKPECQPKGPTQ